MVKYMKAKLCDGKAKRRWQEEGRVGYVLPLLSSLISLLIVPSAHFISTLVCLPMPTLRHQTFHFLVMVLLTCQESHHPWVRISMLWGSYLIREVCVSYTRASQCGLTRQRAFVLQWGYLGQCTMQHKRTTQLTHSVFVSQWGYQSFALAL